MCFTRYTTQECAPSTEYESAAFDVAAKVIAITIETEARRNRIGALLVVMDLTERWRRAGRRERKNGTPRFTTICKGRHNGGGQSGSL
jgi:hypothetical protein